MLFELVLFSQCFIMILIFYSLDENQTSIGDGSVQHPSQDRATGL